MKRTIGIYLRDARHGAGLTQIQVAAKLKLSSAQYISRCENSLCGMAPKQFSKLAKLYKIDVVDIRDVHLADYKTRLDKKLGLRGM